MTKPTADKCPRHENTRLSVHCKDCDETICISCAKTSHDGHSLEVLELKNDAMKRQWKMCRDKISSLSGAEIDLNDKTKQIDELETQSLCQIDEMKE